MPQRRTSKRAEDGEVAVAERPERSLIPWQVLGPIIAAALKIGWEIVRDLVLKK